MAAPVNNLFCRKENCHNYFQLIKIKCIKYKACIAITVAIQGTSRESFYQELGLESLRDRLRFQKLTFFKKLWEVFFSAVSH